MCSLCIRFVLVMCPLCIRYVFAMHSLSFRCVFAMCSLCLRYVFVMSPLCICYDSVIYSLYVLHVFVILLCMRYVSSCSRYDFVYGSSMCSVRIRCVSVLFSSCLRYVFVVYS